MNTSYKRRTFIKASTLTGGGLLLGVNFMSSCKEDVKPPVDVANLNFKDFNAFLKISPEGYATIFSPNPEIGQGVKTSMPMIIAEELDIPWDMVHVVQGKLDNQNYERQVAGGSQSIRHGWDPLRKTGAAAKQMLIQAAANKWEVEVSECKALGGVITNKAGDKLNYGDVVTEASALEIPEDVVLKDPKDYKIIGTDVSNVDIDEIVMGKPLFGLDYKVDGMAYASVMRPPAFGQKLASYDDAAAKSVSGVQEVVQIGDKIAVVADNTWSAIKGKNAIKANWSTDSKGESTSDHDRILNGLLDRGKMKVFREDGNVEKAFAEADEILERTYDSPFLPHNCLEPMNFFANVTSDKIKLVGPIQTPARTAQSIAEQLGRDIKEVDLEMTRMGGGFGRRLYGDFADEAAKISDATKKPIQVVFTREDDMTDGIYRPALKYRFKAAIKDGKLTAYHLKEAGVNANMYGLIPNFFPAGAIDNYKVEGAKHESNITVGAWRAPFTNFLASAEQSFFDELAELMEVDPVQMRLDLLENVKGTEDERIQYSAERMQEVIKLAAAKSGWGKQASGVHQGFVAYYCHNTHVAQVANVALEDGKPVVKKVICAVDCGIVVNPLGALNQVEGGVVDGVGHALYGDFGFENGVPTAKNFDKYRLIRMKEAPEVETHFVKNALSPTGLGEPSLPPAGGAIANAIAKATGKRMYKQPYINSELLG